MTVLKKLLGFGVTRRKLIPWLELVSLLYLAGPVAIWFFGWLIPGVALLCATLLCVGLAFAWWGTRRHFLRSDISVPEGDQVIPLWVFAGILTGAGYWAAYSGAGGFGFLNADWAKHFAVLRDLVEGSWPVAYRTNTHLSPLVYYLAYYLPAALAAKVFGWPFGCLTMALTSGLGAALAALWFSLLLPRRPMLGAIYFVFANGLDFLGDRLVSGQPVESGIAHIDWWSGWIYWNYPGHYSQFIWAPQHSLAAWIIVGLLTTQLRCQRGLGHAGLLAAISFYWSPFTVFGLAPLALFAIFKERFRKIFTVPNLVGVPLLILPALYYASHSQDVPHSWVWNYHDMRVEWPRFMMFHLLEWILFLWFARDLRRSDDPWLRGLFWISCGILGSYSLYQAGLFNDWCMRTTIPALFLFWAGTMRSLLKPPFDLENRILLLLCLFGVVGAMHEFARGWRPLGPPPPLVDQPHVPGLPPEIGQQYLGRDDSWFFSHLAKRTEPLVVVPDPTP